MTDENPLKTHCLDALEKKLIGFDDRNLLETERETLDVICNLLPLYYHSRTGEPLYPNVNVAFSYRRFTLTWFLPGMVNNSFSINFGDEIVTNYVIETPYKKHYLKVHQKFYPDPDKRKEMEPAFLSGFYKAYTDFFLDPDYESKPQRNHHK